MKRSVENEDPFGMELFIHIALSVNGSMMFWPLFDVFSGNFSTVAAIDTATRSLQIEATLSIGHSQLLKTMKELTANSSKDALVPESLTNLMTTKGVAENHDKQIAISVFTSQFYSHSKHYYPLLLTFQTLHNPLN
ncbi:hypothetical protein NC651_026525 [Populus alba x Populus x berolinensis]|nr:hypothetical protein NC651_026525 [Populus alba x Populus x berolinensis]